MFVSDVSFSHISKLQQLRKCNLRGRLFTSATFASFCSLPWLESADVECTDISAAEVCLISRLSSLKHLHFHASAFEHLPPECLQAISVLPSLTTLSLSGQPSLDTLEPFRTCTQLVSLDLLHTNHVDDEKIRALCGLRHLTHLSLDHGPGVTGEGLADAVFASSLVRLNFEPMDPSESWITEAGAAVLGRFTK